MEWCKFYWVLCWFEREWCFQVNYDARRKSFTHTQVRRPTLLSMHLKLRLKLNQIQVGLPNVGYSFIYFTVYTKYSFQNLCNLNLDSTKYFSPNNTNDGPLGAFSNDVILTIPCIQVQCTTLVFRLYKPV
jgi:hypothetical protein